MKNIVKLLVLGAMTVGALVGCDDKTSSTTPTTSQEVTSSSQITSSDSSISSALPSSDSHSSAQPSSSSSSSIAPSSSSATSSSSVTSSSTPASSSIAPTLTGITLNTENVKKEYRHKENLDLTGLVVTANYSDNSTKAVTDYSTNPSNGSALNLVGSINVIVSYQTFTADFTITVNKQLVGVAINTDNVKKEYEQGEALDLTGLVVTAKYSDNTTAKVTDYTTNPENGTVFNEIKEETITVTYGPYTETFNVNVVKPTKRNWTAEESKIMSDHLYGVVLPYTGFEESVVTYSAQYDTVYINGGAATAETLESYARAMSFNGFVMTYNTGSYIFRKTLNTEAGERYLKVVYYIDETNQFSLEAYDPYVYSFPTDAATYLALKLGSQVVAPAFTATRYEVDLQNGAIFCYTESTTAVADYTSILDIAGWDVTGGLDAVTGFYTAIAPDKSYMLYYKYDTEQHHSLDIYFYPVNFWNDEPIKAFYAKYADFSIDIPALSVTGASYLFEESELNASAYASGQLEFVHAFMYVIGGKQENLAPYATLLTNNGWEVAGGNTYYEAKKAVGTQGLARIEASYDRTVGVIVTFYAKLDPFPTTGWPYERVAELLGEDITDTVPAYTASNNGYTVLNDAFGTAVVVAVDTGTEESCIGTYRKVLLFNGYELVEGMTSQYISPNKQIIVSVYKGTSGSFTIEFYPAPYYTWPTAKIASMLNTLFGNITEVVPAYTGGVEYTVDENDGDLYITITLPEDVEADDAVTAYVGILTTNKFTETGVDADDDMHYSSELGQLDVCPYANLGDLVIYVTSLNAKKWPSDDIEDWLSAKNFTDALPQYEGEYVSAYTEDDEGQFSVVIVLDNASSKDIEDAMSGYCYTLYQSQFTHTYTLPFGLGEEYTSPNNQFTVIVSPTDDGFELLLDEAEKPPVTGGNFPSETILEYFPQANGILPVIADEDATYETDAYTGYVGLTVAFADRSDAEYAYSQYIADLVEYNYVAQEIWGGYATAYYSPDGTFCVVLTEYFNANTVYIDYYDADSPYL